MSRRGFCVLLAAALAAGACAGTTTEVLSELGLPINRGDAQVIDRVQHGAYVLATLQGDDFELRFLVPNTPECFRVLQVPGRVDYWREGKLGDLERGATRCQPVGIASLEAWRDRSARPVSATLPASEDASFNAFFVDAGVILLRGSFPQATRIGWRPTSDIVAMLPRNPACDAVANAGSGRMKFHAQGFPAFTLSSGDLHCAVIGLADPI